ncbi:ankyrin-1 [Colletotrichum spaethianum]|uniref:Ankyrin-1 n=1 Tax=Colletotrichum spaethianum TaxID=700344 RepID=A0AA37P8U6_9PEZI|nr:ankyrin-1 [Colletotrichum spaethianum]GKT47767.1 ankyrin-1 [Colletotrichum spaethianum]
MKKILEAGPIDPQIGILRYKPDHEYVSWDPKVMSAGERFRHFYRRDGRQFQQREDFFAHFAEEDPMEEYGPFSDDSSFTEDNISEHNGFFLEEYDDSDDMDDSSSEQFSENASVADHYSAGEASDDAESSNDDANLNVAGGLGTNGGNNFGDNDDDGDLASDDGSGLDDEAMFEEFEEVEREMIGIIRYPDQDDYDEVDEHDIKGLYWFPVHIAARCGNLSALKLLVDFGALLNISSKGFCCRNHDTALYWSSWDDTHPAWTPFHVALCHGHPEVVKYMLKACPHIQERLLSYDEPPWSMLPVFISAIRHGYPKLAEFSLEQGIDDATDGDPDLSGATLLWRAFWETDRFKEALAILLRHGSDINHDLGQGHTLLVEACLRGNFEEGIALVNAGADVTVVLHSPGPATALDYAWDDMINSVARFPGRIEGCGVLDICCGMPPIMVQRGMAPAPQRPPSPASAPDIIRLLLNSKALHATKQSPLHIAAAAHNSKALKILLNFGMDPTSLDEEGSSVLFLAATTEGSSAPPHEFGETISIIAKHLRQRRGTESAMGTSTRAGADEATTNGDVALRNLMENETVSGNLNRKLARHAAALKLIEEGLADINTRDKFGRTTLMLLVAEGDVASARQLMQRGAQVECGPERDDLPAMWVGFIMDEYGHNAMETYRFLSTLDSEKRILRDPQFLAFAIYDNRAAIVDMMLPSFEPDTLILTGGKVWREIGDRQAAILANETNNAESMFEAYRPQIPHRDGWTLLHIAVEFGFQRAVEKLISDLGADANQPNPDSHSPLHIAIKTDSLDNESMIRLLCKHGADPHTSSGETTKSPVDYAIQEGYSWMVPDLLREHPIKGDPKAQSNLYLHSIISTQIKGRPGVARDALPPLIRAGADVNETDSNGDTPLSFFIKEALRLEKEWDLSGLGACVTMLTVPTLIRSGARPSVRNTDGKTVLDMMDAVRNRDVGPYSLGTFLRSTLLYEIMLYRKSIGM